MIFQWLLLLISAQSKSTQTCMVYTAGEDGAVRIWQGDESLTEKSTEGEQSPTNKHKHKNKDEHKHKHKHKHESQDEDEHEGENKHKHKREHKHKDKHKHKKRKEHGFKPY